MTRKIIIKTVKALCVVYIVILLLGNFNITLIKTKDQLRIISMNISAGNILSTVLQNNLIETQPDIIILIEWTGNNLDLAKFKKEGYYVILDHPRKKVHGLCILSKIDGLSTVIEAPVETPCALPLGQFRFKWQDSAITLFAIHAPPPVPSCKGTTSDYLKAVAG